MGDNIDVEKLREENLENIKASRFDIEHLFYIDGVPYQSKQLKDTYFGDTLFSIAQKAETKYLRERVVAIEDNMSEEETKRMELTAKSISIVSDRRKAYRRPITSNLLRGTDEEFMTKYENRELSADIENQDIGDYIFESVGNDLGGLFVNKQKKEAILAFRGLAPLTDGKDTFQLGAMAIKTFTQAERADEFGKQFKKDKIMAKRTFNAVKQKYPGYKIVVTGFSRGGKLALVVGRAEDIEYHAFSPAGSRADFKDSTPRRGGRLYYHHRDPVSLFHHRGKGITEEQHFEAFNYRFNVHDIRDYFENPNTRYRKHPTKPPQEKIEEEALREVISPDEITPEEYVLCDMGLFYDEDECEVDDTPPSPVYFSADDPEKTKRTAALTRDVPSERTIFNIYEPSVFTDLNLRPVKPFEPITFEEIDSDNNNKITKKELSSYLSKRGYDDDTITQLFDTYDINKDGSITRNEFTDLKRML